MSGMFAEVGIHRTATSTKGSAITPTDHRGLVPTVLLGGSEHCRDMLEPVRLGVRVVLGVAARL